MIKAILFDLGGTLVPEEGKAKTLPHVPEALAKLRFRFKHAVIRNATTATLDRVKGVLKEAGILDFFDAVVVSTDVGYSKPDERIRRIALGKLGVEPKVAIVAGERISTDILCGNRMRMKTAQIEWGDKHREEFICELEKHSYIIYSLKGLMPIVRELEKNPS